MTLQTDITMRDTELTIEQQLEWHLTSAHFPPIATSMIRACVKAIDACNTYNHTKLIGLPKGMGYKGLTVAPAGTIVNECNLEQWTVTTTN